MMTNKQSQSWCMIWIVIIVALVGISFPAEAVTIESEVLETPAPAIKTKKDKAVKAGDKITGTVKDAEGPLTGAYVVEIDEYGRILQAAIADINGNFTLKVVNPQNKIRISYIGMKTQTLDISGNKYDVMMESNTTWSVIPVVGHRDSIDSKAPRYNDDIVGNGDDRTFNLVEQMPSFPGGEGEIINYLSTHLRYPAVAREMQAEAVVTVQFVIDKTGLVRFPKVVEVNAGTMEPNDDAVEALKEEAVYVVRNMPRWEPGRQNGKRVNVTYTLPISFSLK